MRKNILLLLLLLVPFFLQAQNNTAKREAGMSVSTVFERVIALDSIGYKPTLAILSMSAASNTVAGNTTSTATFTSDIINLDADTIGFVVEITEVTFLSGGTNRLSRTYTLATPDSLGMAIKLQPLTPGGLGSINAIFNNTIAAAGGWRFGFISVDTLRSNAVFGVAATKADRITFVENIKTASFPVACSQGRLVFLIQNWKTVDRTRFRLTVRIIKKWSGI